MARDNIILPHKILKSMRNLSDAECGRLFRALLQYSMGESQSINLQGREIGLFDVYTQDIDDDIAAYERKCKTNRANGTQSPPVAPSRPQSPHNNNININNNSNNKDNNNHHDDDARADADPLVMYAVNNLQTMSPGNLHDLAGYAEDLPADVIRFAIDEGCANGAPRWSYVAAILRGYLRDGIKTVGDAKAAKAKRKTKLDRSPQDNPAQGYEQREYKDEDYGDDFFINLDEYGEV